MRRRWLLVAVAAGLASACGGGATPSPQPATPPARAAGPVAQAPVPAPLVQPKEPEPAPALPPLAYDPKKRRDPFVAVTLPTPPAPQSQPEPKGLSMGAVKLVGIVAGRRGPLALVEAPDGIGYILKPGDVLGDGRVTAIGNNVVDFALTSRPGQPPITFSLRLGTD